MPPNTPPPRTEASTTVVDERAPSRATWWASCLLGMGLFLIGAGHFLQGDYQQASLDFAGAFGTLGLPALAGRGYHLEIRRGSRVSTSPPPAYRGMPRLSDSNEDLDAPRLPVGPKP